MGRASKSWMTLVRKAKSLVSFKSSKKSKETGSDIDTTNGVLHEPEEGNVSELGSEEKTFEFKEEDQESGATEDRFPETPAIFEVNELQTAETVRSTHAQLDGFPPPTTSPSLKDKELAAVKIQAAFRGAMARKRLKAMKAVERLRSVLHGKATKKQTSNAMRCMQSYAKMQSQVKIQRARLTEFQLQLRKEQEEAKRTEEELEDWDDSTFSKEQILAKVRSKHQAAARRERTLAYAFSHQLWRSYPRDLLPPPVDDDDEKPAWTWNWLEQWMSTRSWKSLEDGVTVTSGLSSPVASPLRKFPTQPKSPLSNGKTISSPRFYPSPQRNKASPNGSYDTVGSKSPAWRATKSSPLHPATAGVTKNKSLLQRAVVLTPNNARQ